MRIFLIGMPLAGKSTIGTQIALDLKYFFVDLDTLIEEKCQKSITAIFTDDGEPFFRKVEQEILNTVINDYVDNVIIATGGGTVIYNDFSQVSGLKILLDVNIQTIKKRMGTTKTRPLLLGNSLEKIYQVRLKAYLGCADITIDNNGSIDETIERIKTVLKNNENIDY